MQCEKKKRANVMINLMPPLLLPWQPPRFCWPAVQKMLAASRWQRPFSRRPRLTSEHSVCCLQLPILSRKHRCWLQRVVESASQQSRNEKYARTLRHMHIQNWIWGWHLVAFATTCADVALPKWEQHLSTNYGRRTLNTIAQQGCAKQKSLQCLAQT